MTIKKTKTTKSKKIKIEPMTVSQFRAKLEGIEMFQEDEWHPSKEQWELIREMINNIKETEEVEKENFQNDYNVGGYSNHQGWPQQNTVRPPISNNPVISSLSGSIQQDNPIPELPISTEIVPSGKPTVKTEKIMGKTGPAGTFKSSFE